MNHRQVFQILCGCAVLYLSTNSKLMSIGANTLSANQILSDKEVLISPSQIFELGFFSPASSAARFVGIWYKATPDVVVWVANRQNPITGLNGVLTLSKNGNLLLNSGTTIWSSNSSTTASDPFLQLLDSGNLVIEANSMKLWQSFDSPSDTLLPGMKLLQETDAPNLNVLRSWKSRSDPAVGEFTFGIVNRGLSQMIITKGKERRYRAIFWDGHFPGFPDSVDVTWNPEIGSTGGRLVSISQPLDDSVRTRLVMNDSGSFQRFIMDDQRDGWDLMITSPRDSCDSYGWCGTNGVCKIYKTPECECLPGFNPKSEKEWRIFDWRSGCSRNLPLEADCQKKDGFLKVQGVRFPDSLSFRLNTSMDIKECRDQCLKNCNCTAYADPYFRNETNCLMWFGDLIDIREQAADARNGPSIYIRVPDTELDRLTNSTKKAKGSAKTKIILIAVFSTMLLLVLCLGGFLLWRRGRKQALLAGYRRTNEELELPLFDLATIVAATNNFSNENMLGEGGFGPVYKGNLSAEHVVAVKRMSKYSGQGHEEFKNEIILISKLQHRNLVRILGCCIEGEEKMLIYEYMQNKSLDYYIFDQARGSLLDWPKRIEIIMEIARGLLYLHHDSRLKIIHRDLKTSNILLDENLNAKISDFGLARMFEGDQTAARTKRVVGTYGYMAPEYAFDGKFSIKSDVFSMGVVILEIVSGKRNRGFKVDSGYQNLLEQAWLLWKENRELELMDPCYSSSYVESQVKRCIQIGLLCVQNFADERPMMPSVVLMLSTEDTVLPQPKKPAFFVQSDFSSSYKIRLGSEKWSSGRVTMSDVEAR